MPFSRKLLVSALAIAPLTAHVACAVSNGDADPPEVRDAGALEASRTARADAADEEEDAGTRDGARDANIDAPDSESPAEAVVEINEIYVDIDGLGDGAEFVELRADPGTAVDDLRLRILDASGSIKYTVTVADPGEKVGASGLWVVGGNQTFKLGVPDRVDQPIALANWGLPTSRGAVQLVRGNAIVDVVSWATEPEPAPIPAPSTLPAETGEGTAAARVPTIRKTAGTPAHSFGRREGTPDTDDNQADFCSMIASPGYGQKGCD